jgi:hypothetical protein
VVFAFALQQCGFAEQTVELVDRMILWGSELTRGAPFSGLGLIPNHKIRADSCCLGFATARCALPSIHRTGCNRQLNCLTP